MATSIPPTPDDGWTATPLAGGKTQHEVKMKDHAGKKHTLSLTFKGPVTLTQVLGIKALKNLIKTVDDDSAVEIFARIRAGDIPEMRIVRRQRGEGEGEAIGVVLIWPPQSDKQETFRYIWDAEGKVRIQLDPSVMSSKDDTAINDLILKNFYKGTESGSGRIGYLIKYMDPSRFKGRFTANQENAARKAQLVYFGSVWQSDKAPGLHKQHAITLGRPIDPSDTREKRARELFEKFQKETQTAELRRTGGGIPTTAIVESRDAAAVGTENAAYDLLHVERKEDILEIRTQGEPE